MIEDNHAAESAEAAERSPGETLAAITIMPKRDPGYDSEHEDRYWPKFQPDGEVAKGPRGEALAGKVTSCIRCHGPAQGDGCLFFNDA